MISATFAKWASFVRLSHTLFALPFALAAMVVAARDLKPPGWPGWRTFGLIVSALICARMCAMAFNRIADRKLDALNPRTAGRHLPTGQITVASAWAFWGVAALGFVASAWALNPLCLWLSPLALFLVCFYSLTKRFTDFSHAWLGVALALAPLGAWLAVEGRFDFLPFVEGQQSFKHGAVVPLVLAAAVILWLTGFDIIYATQDYEFDRRHGLHSLVVRWGPHNALGVAFLCHLFMWVLLALFGALNRFRLAYWVGLVLILGLLVMEHWFARKRDPQSINIAFFKLNAVISVIFLVGTTVEIVFPWFRLRWY